MGRFDFQSGGAEAGAAIQQYFNNLIERRRQAEADQLNRQREARLAEQHRADLALRQSQLEESRLNAEVVREGREIANKAAKREADLRGLTRGQQVSPELAAQYPNEFNQAAPAVVEQREQIGEFTAADRPDLEGVPQYRTETTKEATPATYRGTAAEQKDFEEQRVLLEAISKIPDPKNRQMMELAVRSGSKPTLDQITKMMGPQGGRIFQQQRDGTIHILDMQAGGTRKVTPQDAPFDKQNDQFVTEPAVPQQIALTQFDPMSIEVYASLIDAGVVNPTITRGNAPLMDAAMRLLAQRRQAAGGSATSVGADIAENRAGFVSDQATLTRLNNMTRAVSAFENTTIDNAKMLDETLNSIPNLPASFLNSPVRALATTFGSESMSRFNALRQSVLTEYSRIINNPNLTGTLTDSARLEMDTILDPNATVGQIRAALRALSQEAHNRRVRFQGEIQDLKQGVRARATTNERGNQPNTPGQAPAVVHTPGGTGPQGGRARGAGPAGGGNNAQPPVQPPKKLTPAEAMQKYGF